MDESAHNSKIIFSLLILVIAFVIFLVFYKNQEAIAFANLTGTYVIFSAVGLGLLTLFMFLIGNRKIKVKATPKSKSKKKKK